MSWTYSGNPANSKLDEVRFTIGDTDANFPQITDEEINYTLSHCNNVVINASILCCEAIVRKLAKEVDYKIGPESVEASKRFEQYSKILAGLQKSNLQRIAVPTMTGPTTESSFNVGMHDNYSL